MKWRLNFVSTRPYLYHFENIEFGTKILFINLQLNLNSKFSEYPMWRMSNIKPTWRTYFAHIQLMSSNLEVVLTISRSILQALFISHSSQKCDSIRLSTGLPKSSTSFREVLVLAIMHNVIIYNNDIETVHNWLSVCIYVRLYCNIIHNWHTVCIYVRLYCNIVHNCLSVCIYVRLYCNIVHNWLSVCIYVRLYCNIVQDRKSVV